MSCCCSELRWCRFRTAASAAASCKQLFDSFRTNRRKELYHLQDRPGSGMGLITTFVSSKTLSEDTAANPRLALPEAKQQGRQRCSTEHIAQGLQREVVAMSLSSCQRALNLLFERCTFTRVSDKVFCVTDLHNGVGSK